MIMNNSEIYVSLLQTGGWWNIYSILIFDKHSNTSFIRHYFVADAHVREVNDGLGKSEILSLF